MTVPLYNLTDTWNNGATVFTAILMNVTDTASDASSLMMDLQIGGNPIFRMSKARTFSVFNAYTDAANYERGIFDWNATANVLSIGTQAAGTGTQRVLRLLGAGAYPAIDVLGNGDINIGGANGGTSAYFPAVVFSGNATTRFYYGSTIEWQIGEHLQGAAAAVFRWTPTNANGLADTGISRSAAGVIAFGNGGAGDASATIVAKTKAGAPTTGDVPAGTFALIRDTTNATTKMYYNNAGALQSVALV